MQAQSDPRRRAYKSTADLPATIHRDLVVYAEAIGRETSQTIYRQSAPVRERFEAESGKLGEGGRMVGLSQGFQEPIESRILIVLLPA